MSAEDVMEEEMFNSVLADSDIQSYSFEPEDTAE